jgi:hypothetical protein
MNAVLTLVRIARRLDQCARVARDAVLLNRVNRMAATTGGTVSDAQDQLQQRLNNTTTARFKG